MCELRSLIDAWSSCCLLPWLLTKKQCGKHWTEKRGEGMGDNCCSVTAVRMGKMSKIWQRRRLDQKQFCSSAAFSSQWGGGALTETDTVFLDPHGSLHPAFCSCLSRTGLNARGLDTSVGLWHFPHLGIFQSANTHLKSYTHTYSTTTLCVLLVSCCVSQSAQGSCAFCLMWRKISDNSPSFLLSVSRPCPPVTLGPFYNTTAPMITSLVSLFLYLTSHTENGSWHIVGLLLTTFSYIK